MTDIQSDLNHPSANALLPEAARRYLAHTTDGRPIREIAREVGCHASTILRQVRKLETLRDDPLVDRVLAEPGDLLDDPEDRQTSIDAATRALRLLCLPRAMMLYSADLPKPAIIKTVDEDDTELLGAIELDLAAALIMRNWIAPEGGTSIKRYRITAEGRGGLSELIAAQESRAALAQSDASVFLSGTGNDRRSRSRAVSNGPGFESPLSALARRRGPDGSPFLSPDLVSAGDRLHEDYAIAGFGKSDLIGWDGPGSLKPHYEAAHKMKDRRRSAALLRTLDAIRDLGPGLSEVVLRCCCLREGLEATEKRLGWSARSGKVVLRIALQRLSLFYGRTLTKDGAMIG
ncbi:DUF6456 domain-containing protein [Marivita geojedonensis]|uniref:DUF6456 domain-containing protein n=1 Tax=Marivita geojedonensis TaxID=1123756 RepID=UPI000A1DE6AF|nr:DUF6456 domain-containing protein [Marivita geojedonensis]PRY81062.1 hypothetical protein CLV76_10219 [Marivita geojedonensis]